MNLKIQNIVIAESCGWRIPDHCISKRRQRGETERKLKGAPPDFGDMPKGWPCETLGYSLPSFVSDLNAILTAVRLLPNDQQWYCFSLLAEIVDPRVPAATATAEEWSKAYLRTIGKWEDSK